MKKYIAAAALLAPLLASASGPELVANGSFEADAVASNTWVITQNITGWQGGLYGIETRNNAVGTAYDGNNFVELDTSANSSMSQSVGTYVGQVLLSFYFSARPETSAATNGLSVLFGGQNIALSVGGNPDSVHHWQQYTGLFNLGGTSATNILSFYATGTSDSYGTSLDKVSVTAVPEPETFALFLAGLGMLGLMAKRRRQS
jgi:hypothetical protein